MEFINPSLVFLVGFAIFILIMVIKGVKVVSQSDIYVIERLGKFNKELYGGLNFIIPVIDNVTNVLTKKEQTIDIRKQSVITKDNVNIAIDGIVFCKVEDGKMATYNVQNFKLAIRALAQTTLRSVIGSMELDQTLSNRETINTKLLNDLGQAANNWGITITRVEISDIEVPRDIQKSMNMQMEAERKKRAIETTAEAEKNQQIRRAEGFKREEVLKAEAIERMADAKKYEQEKIAAGQSKAMETINEAMDKNEKAAQFLLAKDSIRAFKEIASSDSKDKIILPYDVTKSLGAVSLMGDAFFGGLKKDQ